MLGEHLRNPEGIYLNWGQDGEVVADFTPGASDILVDAYTFGFALRQTTNTLGIIRHDIEPNRAIFNADNEIVEGRLPQLAASAERIAAASSLEQPYYQRNEAERCKVVIGGILSKLLEDLPNVLAEGAFMDTCEHILLPFSKVSTGDAWEIKVVQSARPFWRLTPEERCEYDQDIGAQAEDYLKLMDGR